jgi:hypothetical protein
VATHCETCTGGNACSGATLEEVLADHTPTQAGAVVGEWLALMRGYEVEAFAVALRHSLPSDILRDFTAAL